MRELNENARKVEEIRHGLHLVEGERKMSIPVTGVFDDLNVDVVNEEGSDVRVLGTIKGESKPPLDAPLPDYGRRLLDLREHIHRRVCGAPRWRGRSVEEFSDYITMVWKCIERSNFHLNFVAAYERMNYDILVHKVDQCAQKLTTLYCTTFDTVSKDIRKDADHRSDGGIVNIPDLLEKYDDKLAAKMMTHLHKLDGDVNVILEDKRFTKWSTDQLSRWKRYKTDQAAHWRRLIDGQVNNIFLYESLVEGYKKKLRDEANGMFRDGKFKKLTLQEQQRKFDALFDKLVTQASEQNPPFNEEVAQHVDQVFADNKDLVWVTKGGSRAFKPSWPFSLVFSHSYAHRQKCKLHAIEYSIKKDIKQTLAGVTQYSDGIVGKCIQLTKVALVDAEKEMPVSDAMKEKVFRSVTKLIRTELQRIQYEWDKKNSVSARFASCRPQMKSYFKNLGKGWLGMVLLEASVCDWLSNNMQMSFEEELTTIVGTTLKGKRWVVSADVMQALVDNSLVQYLEMKNIKAVLGKVSNPKDHIKDVVSHLIAHEVLQCSTKKLEAYKQALKESISAAARSAADVKKDCALTFLSTLKSKLREYLHTPATNCLLTTMPDAGDPNFNCDEQSTDIFDPSNKDFVCSKMLDTVDAMSNPSVDVTPAVLAFIKDRAHGASRGVMPRCGELCPLCKSPCTRELGHVTTEEEKRHDSYHQPVGLVGGRNVRTDELVPGSCYFNANNGWRFHHSDGKWYEYSKFDQVFPNWSLPVEKEPLLLREHIFYNYQDDLASFFSLKKCTELPPAYNHPMSDIKQHIGKLMS
ncbi:unnamed protein product [Phytophthora fragariaefolia]|uniref:Unnamed protein product n=1 Tax=Phytophthora fragariaefolia TaxID=1490495 RepID=A0A9W6XPP5_9STRA|nr:unnamed protein product [Phytophthora fragariaefolia]